MKKISRKDILGLTDFIETVHSKIEEHNLDEIFDVRRQIVGPLGEAISLVKLYEQLGDEYEYIWFGRRVRDYDLIIRKEHHEKKIQIKTSSAKDWAFSITVKGFADQDVVRDQLREGNFTISNKIIEDDIMRRDVDFWVFLHAPSETFYVFDNEGVIRSIQADYHRYVTNINSGGRGPGNNYAIVNDYVRYIQKGQYLSEIWEDYRERWDIIRNSFSND